MGARVITGDCLEVMPTLEAGSVDAIVCDPPYGLSFMGKGWDHAVPGVEFWEAALRVAKPGAHLVAFGGTRLYHRLTCAIEDAGWEVRDCLSWLYGSGFPKSLDVGKAIDKASGVWRGRAGRVISENGSMSAPNYERSDKGAPATPAAKQWDGWGTALKPAWEPIVLARKPLDGTVAANVQAHGCGGLNVDGCRVGYRESRTLNRGATTGSGIVGHGRYGTNPPQIGAIDGGTGRWPANLVLDEEASLFLGPPSRFFYCPKASAKDRDAGVAGVGALRDNGRESAPRKNTHPTVKPTELMRWLCRLVTPPGGTILDPFTGSGSTGKAAVLEGFNFTGIEMDEAYADIARQRIEHAKAEAEAA